jgi:CRP-like cAMP-binding protein
MASLQESIAAHPFLKKLDPKYLPWLTERAKETSFSAGDTIAKEGEAAQHFYLITAGKVEIEGLIPEHGQVSLQTLTAGDALGWSWLFPPFKWHFTAKALEETRAVVWDTAQLLARAEVDPKFGFEMASRMTGVLLRRLQATRNQLLGYYEN